MLYVDEYKTSKMSLWFEDNKPKLICIEMSQKEYYSSTGINRYIKYLSNKHPILINYKPSTLIFRSQNTRGSVVVTYLLELKNENK